MSYLQNLHTHSSYCDGADAPEEIIIAAMEKGFDSIGFSGHSFMRYSNLPALMVDNTVAYKKEITRLKEKYNDKIKIFSGLEVEMYSGADLSGYDYLIGSVHYLKTADTYVGFDRSAEDVEKVINKYFEGSGIKYAKAYYDALSQLPDFGNFDIIGHFDIITKHKDTHTFFDEDSKEYLDAAFSAAHALKGKIPYFEVNTGAVARGYRKTPYPSIPIIKELKRLGFGVCITSDCHDKNKLDWQFDEAKELLKECGFKEHYNLTEDGFKAQKL